MKHKVYKGICSIPHVHDSVGCFGKCLHIVQQLYKHKPLKHIKFVQRLNEMLIVKKKSLEQSFHPLAEKSRIYKSKKSKSIQVQNSEFLFPLRSSQPQCICIPVTLAFFLRRPNNGQRAHVQEDIPEESEIQTAPLSHGSSPSHFFTSEQK